MSDHEPCTCASCPVHGGKRETTKLSPQRIAARAGFAEFLHAHFVAAHRRGKSLVPSWAVQLDVTEKTVRQWANMLKTHAVIGAGDLDAIEPVDLVELLEAWLERAKARLTRVEAMGDPRLVILGLMERVTDASKTVRRALSAKSLGGTRITADEWREFVRDLAELERQAREAKLAAQAAAEREAA